MTKSDRAGGPDRARRRRNYWTAKSDEELLGLDFYSADPTKLPNLLAVEPDTDEVPEVEFSYDTTITGTGMVRCVHCKKAAPNHNRGFVLQFHDGSRLLIGKDCGKKLYGENFSSAERDYRAAKDRSGYLKKRRDILGAKSQLVDLFERIEGNPCWKVYGDLKRTFNVAMPELAKEFGDAVRVRDGALYADTRISDVEAEVAYEKRTGRHAPFYKTVSAIHGVLVGQSFFRVGDRPPDKIVPDLVRRAKASLWTLAEEDKSTRDLQLFFTSLNQLVAAIRHEATRIAELPLAFGPENSKRIAAWVAANHMPSFYAEPDRWFIGTRSGPAIAETLSRGLVACEVKLPNVPWPMAPMAEIEAIEALLA